MSISFADLGVSEAADRALHARGVTAPFAVQRLVIPDVLAGRDVLAQSPTGSGKTLAFGVPLLDRLDARARRPSALILAPTRELASQIADELGAVAAAHGLTVATVYGGVGLHAQAQRARRAHLLVATPGRLLDLIERGDVALGSVRMLVLDEADRMLDMGFKPVVDRIVGMTPPTRQTLLFSATLEGPVGALGAAYTRDARRHEHRPAPERRGDVEHRFLHVDHEDKVPALVEQLAEPARGRTLVFVRTKRGADRLVKKLSGHGVGAVAMHGDKSQGQRERALAAFEAGRVDTLVATDVAARGIDVADVTHVINYDAPAAREDYVHRIGRTARAGARGVGITFVTGEQAREVATIAHELGLRHPLGETDRPARPHVQPASPSAR
ncbi:MAG TPA: DEAD/DEAH box helicase, partial [Solirubrobacteraceae bacterium]|nr:DEAD/DEAH box helicase [Solirubrobacteraceae bacterium]